jgi:hypothetical protein
MYILEHVNEVTDVYVIQVLISSKNSKFVFIEIYETHFDLYVVDGYGMYLLCNV